MDLQEVYDRLAKEEPWFCMMESGAAEKDVRLVQEMYESRMTVRRCGWSDR